MEIGGAAGESAEDRAFHFSDVVPQAGDQRAAGIGGGLHFKGGVVGEGEDGEIADVERTGKVADTDVDGQRKGVIAGVRSGGAGAAGAGKGGDSENIVQSGDTGDVDGRCIKDRLAAGDAG